MEASSLPNLNRETTSYHNFFTFFQDPNHHDDTTLHKRQKIDHSQVSEPSETSPPFKDILSPLVSFNGSNENHYPVGGYFYEWDQNQMDQTLPRLPPSPTRSSDTDDSVGSNPFSGNVGARSEGLYVTQLRGDQTIPSMSSVGSKVLDTISAQVPVFLLERTSNSIDDGHAWRKYGQKVILNYNYPSDRTRDSDDDDDDDDQDSDDDVAASANNLRRAIRYGIYGNDDIEEAHGSLERDDEDVYFDDESAEVVLSSLRLGDDRESGSLFTNSNWFAFEDNRTINEHSADSIASPSPNVDDSEVVNTASDAEFIIDKDEDLVDTATSQLPEPNLSSEPTSINLSGELSETEAKESENPPEWVEWRETSDSMDPSDPGKPSILPNGEVQVESEEQDVSIDSNVANPSPSTADASVVDSKTNAGGSADSTDSSSKPLEASDEVDENPNSDIISTSVDLDKPVATEGSSGALKEEEKVEVGN